MNRDFERRLAEALADLDRGQDIPTILARYPDVADALAPLLETAAYAREVLDYFEPPSAEGLAAGHRRMLEAAARKRMRAAAQVSTSPWWERVLAALGPWFRPPVRALATAALLLALFLAISGVTVVAAADSLPGDPLYPVKRMAEQVRLTLTIDPVARAALQARLNRERQAEARAVASLGRRARLRFEGVLERRTDGIWVVDGIALLVDPEVAEEPPAVGSTVVVEVESPGDGTLHVRHMMVHGAPHGSGGPGHAPRTATPSTTPTLRHRRPTRVASPTPPATPTTAPPIPIPTDEMGPEQRHRERHPSPMPGPMEPMMGWPTATPPPTATGVPAQPAPSRPPATHMPMPEPTQGPMMPQPTQEHHPGMPHPTMPPGGGHPGGPGGHHGR